MRLGDAQNQPTEHRARQGANPAEHRCGKRLNANHKPDVEIKGAVIHGDEHTCQARHGRTNDKDQGDNPVGIDPQNGGHFTVLLYRAAHPPQPGMVDYPGQHQHAGKRGDQDKYFGISYLHKTFAQMQTKYAVEHGWHPLLARPLAQLRVVLQDKRHPDGRDKRRQARRVPQRLISNTLDGPAVHPRNDNGEYQRSQYQQGE